MRAASHARCVLWRARHQCARGGALDACASELVIGIAGLQLEQLLPAFVELARGALRIELIGALHFLDQHAHAIVGPPSR